MNAPTSAYLIKRGELNPGWITLYAATLALQLISAAVRYFIAYAVIWIPSKIECVVSAHSGLMSREILDTDERWLVWGRGWDAMSWTLCCWKEGAPGRLPRLTGSPRPGSMS